MLALMLLLGLVLVSVGCSSGNSSRDAQQEVPKGTMIYVIPASMSRIGTIDLRFQSYNVEMLEVTGGKFWKPYGPELDVLLLKGQQAAPTVPEDGDTPAGMNPALYEYRPPIDLTNARLRKLAKGLAPAYVRVSGTWANTTYFPNSDQAPKSPPAGFNGVLTRQQWEGLVTFAKAVDAEIVTSFAMSPGTRDAAGVWTPAQASRFLDYTKSIGGRIAAAEFINEPNLASMGGAPVGYNATAYGRDFKSFRAFASEMLRTCLFSVPAPSVRQQASGGLPTEQRQCSTRGTCSSPPVQASMRSPIIITARPHDDVLLWASRRRGRCAVGGMARAN